MAQRPLSALNEAEILAGHVIPVLFARLDFSPTTLRVHSQIGPITWTHPIFGAEPYTGIGDFGSISAVKEGLSTRPFGVAVKLSGVKGNLVTEAITGTYHRRSAHLFIGLNDTNAALVDTPFEIWSGVMDKPDISQAKNAGQIIMKCESRADIVHEPQGGLYNHETQKAFFSGDLGMEYMAKITMLGPISWGDGTIQPPLGSGQKRQKRQKGPKG